jgi:hypothetical protein
MISAVGVSALCVAVLATSGGAIKPAFGFNGWNILFQAGLLVTTFGVVTLVLEPDTMSAVLAATGVSILLHPVLSVAIGIGIGMEVGFVDFLLRLVVPLAPMGVGYMAGGIRSRTDTSDLRRRTFVAGGVSLGATVWLGAYLLYMTTYAPSGTHGGFVFTFYGVILIGNLVAGGVLYSLWRFPEFTPSLVGNGQFPPSL